MKNPVSRLKVCAFLLGALTLAFGAFTVYAIRNLNERFDTAVNKYARKLELSSRVNTVKSDMYVAQRGFVLATFVKDADRVSASKKEFEAQSAKMKATFDEMRPLQQVRPEGKKMLAELESGFDGWQGLFREVVRQCEGGDPAAAQKLSFEKIAPIYTGIGEVASQLERRYKKDLDASAKDAAADYTLSLWVTALVVLMSVANVAAVLYVTHRLTRELRKAAAELAQGSEQVAGAASQVSSSAQVLAQGASEQAASLEETSSSTEEINSMTHRNLENSASSASVMTQMSERVDEGNRKLEEMVVSMKEINESSEKISKIIKAIDEIAFQTNILALNAAVEAARAGEAGMGFAVVADEVRNLAQRCAQAARDTAALIEDSIAKSNQGARKLDDVASAIVGITEDAVKVKTLVDEVHLGSQEQARGLEQVSRSFAQMDEMTQKTAASAEESAAASQELNAQSEAVREVVKRLAALVGTGDGQASA